MITYIRINREDVTIWRLRRDGSAWRHIYDLPSHVGMLMAAAINNGMSYRWSASPYQLPSIVFER